MCEDQHDQHKKSILQLSAVRTEFKNGTRLLPGVLPKAVFWVEGILGPPTQSLWWLAGSGVWTCQAQEGFDLEPSARRRASPTEAATESTNILTIIWNPVTETEMEQMFLEEE